MIKKWGNFFDHCENRKTAKLLFLFPRSSGNYWYNFCQNILLAAENVFQYFSLVFFNFIN